MSNTLTHLGIGIYASERKGQYDDSIKNLLADPQIIAWILRGTTKEFTNMEIEEIIPYIENPYVSLVPVNPGLTNKAIEGLPTESKIIGEGALYYDVRFYAKIPGITDDKKPFRIIVDLEGQQKPNPGYSIPTRGIAYGSRMISEQFGRTIIDGNYDRLEKVYSIWLVFKCNKEIANTIISYSIDQSFIYGECTYKQRYDVLSVVMISIPEYGKLCKVNNEPSELHKMLYDIFVEKNSAKEKIEIIKEKYNLISETLERRINVMCNLSEALVEDTRKASVNIAKLFMQGKTSEEIEELTDYPLDLIEEVKADLEEQ